MAAFKSHHSSTVRKAVELWNTLSKQNEQQVDCSDSLRSLISSIGSKVDLESSSQKSSSAAHFGAQVTGHNEASIDLSVVTSSDLKAPSAHGAMGAPLQRQPSQSRRRDATPKFSKSKPTEVATTPRLRHDDSQVEFAPIASSSPNNDSQHLTERQKAVRERQKETATMYKNIGSSSPGLPAPKTTHETKDSLSPAQELPQKATPERKASYEQLISSTPTPKRGQYLDIEDLGDPPSSPPEPRPYPLREEIESRSRASSSLEDWDFSSPLATPTTSRQQIAQETEAPESSTRVSTRRSAKRKRDNLVEKEEVMSTPSRRTRLALKQNKEALASTKEQSARSESSPESSLPILPPQPAGAAAPAASNNTSFGVSGLDDEHMMKFVVELELENEPSSVPLASSPPPSSPLKAAGTRESVLPCITVSSSPGVTKQSDNQRDSSAIPSSPVAASDLSSASEQGKRKRKRGIKNPEKRRKRRRSGGAVFDKDRVEESQVVEVPSSVVAEEDQSVPVRLGVQTRRSSRRLDKKTKPASKQAKKKEPEDESHADNTDEELMSQLVEESNAASQSQHERQQEEELVPVPSIATSSVSAKQDSPVKNTRKNSQITEQKKKVETVEEVTPANVVEDATEGTPSVAAIIQTLQGGLEGLRSATLDRDEVYKLEDILMDMKRELYEAERRGRDKSAS